MSVDFEISGPVGRITIDRQDRMNALDSAAHRRLEGILDEVEQNPKIRVVILTGAGENAFCAGADLKEDSGLTGLEYWENYPMRGMSLRPTLMTPVVARVNGLALGGGLELVLGCDIVVAAETARFALPEAKVGRLPLDGGMSLLPRLIPRNIANAMMMTGRMMPAAEMARCGLVNAVVPPDQLDTETDQWVEDILACAPLSLRAIKATVRETAHLLPQDAYRMRSDALVAALVSEDSEEGVRAFREKRKPVWKGR